LQRDDRWGGLAKREIQLDRRGIHLRRLPDHFGEAARRIDQAVLVKDGNRPQVDQIELGVTDIINGNVDRTFRPVGPELDGLANGLNVMLARLLGRPEPGEEEFDEEGNPIIPGRVDFEEGEEKPAVDPDLANLAKESEPDYYKRVFTEYVAARKASGSPDDVSFENFIAKLKVNEGKLKAQYNCRAVRFRVVTKDGKVSLKPVPIFE